MDVSRIDEVLHRHHDSLARWLAAGDRKYLDAFLDAHAADFTLVTVDGTTLTGAELGPALSSAGGSQPGLTIEIDEIAVIGSANDLAVVRFRETHRRGGDDATRRWTTAVLRRAREGWEWVTVHETLEQ